MPYEKELECIRLCHQARRAAKVAKIQKCAKFWQRIERPLGPAGFTPPKNESGHTRWGLTLLWPVIVLLLLVLEAVLLCIMTFACLWSAITTLAQLTQELRAMQEPGSNIHTPTEKTLWALWYVHGPAGDVSREQEIALLGGWVDTLYGPGEAERLNLVGRLDSIVRKRASAEINFRLSNPGSSISLVPPFRTLIHGLSQELPPYIQSA